MIIVMDSLRDTISKNFKRMVDQRPELEPGDITKAAKVSPGMFYKWYNGENIPDPDKVERLAGLFRVDPIDFYKSEATVVPLYGNASLRKYMVIPDEVVELIYKVNPSSEMWSEIMGVLDQAEDGNGGEKQA